YAYVDAAGRQGTLATYTINMSVSLATTLSTFTGKTAGSVNLLSWTSYDETAGTNFTIERSSDGINYAPIGSVAGINGQSTTDHSYTDRSPIPNTLNYYRLEWTDDNGDVAYSN